MLIRRILLFLNCILIIQALNAQVWTLPAKGVYTNLSYSAYNYRDKFDANGEIVPTGYAVSDKTLQLFAQYGLTDKLTLQAVVPYKMMESDLIGPIFDNHLAYFQNQFPEDGKLSYFGNIEVGAIYKLYDKKPVISASLMMSFNSTDRNYLYALQTGFNSASIRPGVGAGWSFQKSWLQFYLAGDIRNNNYADAILSNLEYGFKLGEHFYLAANAYLRQPAPDGADCDCSTLATAVYNSNLKYYGMGFKGGFSIKQFGINASINTAFYAENAPAMAVPAVGIQYKY
jgi:hypothetical protein